MKLKQATRTIKVNISTPQKSGTRGERIRTATLLAWLFWLLVMICATASFALKLNSLLLGHGNIVSGGYLQGNMGGVQYLQQVAYYLILVSALAPSYATVGAIIASRRPGNGVGWLCLALGLLISLQDVTWQYATRALETTPGSLPAGQLMAWLSQLLEFTFPLPGPLPALPLLGMLLLMIFPDGRFLSPRWRFIGWATVIWTCLCRLVILVSPTFSVGSHVEVTNPTGIKGIQAGLTVVESVIPWIGLLVGLGPISSIFVRWKRAGNKERQQLKWLMYMGIVIIASGLLTLASLHLPVSPYIPFLIGAIGVAGFTIGIPVAIGIAILRHRLYDIDIIINRTLVYGTLTALLALLYVGLIFAVQFLLHSIVNQTSTPAIVASTLVIAALIQPLRNSLKVLIDRRFYRRKYNAAKILEAFSASLREQVDLTQLNEQLLAVVNETMQPASVSLWLYQPETQAGTTRVPSTRAVLAGQMDSSLGVIAPGDPLVVYLLSAASAMEIEQLHLDSPALRALQAAGVKLVVPMINQGELVGLFNLGPRRSEQDYSGDDRGLLHRLALQAAPAIRVAQLVRERERLMREQQAQARERERLGQELRIARQIQQAFLPKDLPELMGWQVDAYYQPARTVGGDFYDFLSFEDSRVGIVIGDVTDKGIPAALLMTTTRTILRSVAQRETSPGKILEQTNTLLCPEMPPNMFVTCLYAILDPASGRLRYANAGHDLPYQRQQDRVGELWATGMPLGLMPGMTYEEKEAIVAEGDSLLLYSDGLVEAHNPEHVMFGFPRLLALLEEQRDHSSLIDVLLQHLAAFTGPNWEQEDDLTLVTLQRSPGSGRREIATRSTTRAEETMENDKERVLAEWSVQSEAGNERVAIQQVTAAVATLNLPARRLAALQTAVAEATMNAMEYGNRYQPDKPVVIQVLASKADLSVCIIDHGGSQSIPEPKPPDLEARLAGLQAPRGWGLFLIESLVDDMQVTSDEHYHTVKLMIHLSEESRAGKA